MSDNAAWRGEVLGALVLSQMPRRNPIYFRDLAAKLKRREELTPPQVQLGLDWLGSDLVELADGQGYQLTAGGRAWKQDWAPGVLAGPR